MSIPPLKQWVSLPDFFMKHTIKLQTAELLTLGETFKTLSRLTPAQDQLVIKLLPHLEAANAWITKLLCFLEAAMIMIG